MMMISVADTDLFHVVPELRAGRVLGDVLHLESVSRELRKISQTAFLQKLESNVFSSNLATLKLLDSILRISPLLNEDKAVSLPHQDQGQSPVAVEESVYLHLEAIIRKTAEVNTELLSSIFPVRTYLTVVLWQRMKLDLESAGVPFCLNTSPLAISTVTLTPKSRVPLRSRTASLASE